MKPVLIEANGDDFIVHFEQGNYNKSWTGKAAQIYLGSDNSFQYLSNDSSDPTNKLEDARIWFEWSFCWRGVWEGRIYFIDDEFWSEEMFTMPILWEQIEEIVKKKIIGDNPNDYFDL